MARGLFRFGGLSGFLERIDSVPDLVLKASRREKRSDLHAQSEQEMCEKAKEKCALCPFSISKNQKRTDQISHTQPFTRYLSQYF